MGNRDRHDIVVEILTKASSGPCGKTHIMEKVGLSYGQAQQYLSELLKNGLLETNSQGKLKTTKKGTEFLEKCSQCILSHWGTRKP
jgi:predicted transcriptional regulator